MKSNIENKLIVGAKIRIGEKYAADSLLFKAGDIITLEEGFFDYENGLYTEIQYCPSVWDEESREFHSIYHLFENDLSGFMDCEII